MFATVKVFGVVALSATTRRGAVLPLLAAQQ